MQDGEGEGDVLQFVEAEQADAEAFEVGGFVHLQGNAGGDLQALGGKGAAVLQGGVVGVADDDAGRGVVLRGDALVAVLGEQGARLFAEGVLRFA